MAVVRELVLPLVLEDLFRSIVAVHDGHLKIHYDYTVALEFAILVQT